MTNQFNCYPFYGLKPEAVADFHTGLKTISDSMRPETFFWAASNLIAWKRYFGFMRDPKFAALMAKHNESEVDWGHCWHMHILLWAAQNVLGHVEGDFVECGVFKGMSMGMLCDYVDFEATGRALWLYDRFSDYSQGDMKKPMQGHEDDLKSITAKRFEKYSHVKMIDGVVPDSFKQGIPEKIAFIHIDMNEAAAERAALETLWPSMQPGCMVVLDDYGSQGLPNQTNTHNEFFASKRLFVAELPTGQGLVVIPPNKQ